MTETIFDRYGDLAGDREQFREASTTPLPTTAWANPPLWPAVRGLLPALEERLAPIGWHGSAFKIDDGTDPGFVTARLLGGLHSQEEAAMVPVRMLGLGGDERVLDACAAPGNKSAAMAVSLRAGGRVIAVDINAARMGVLRTTLNTLGIVRVAGLVMDASDLPDSLGSFDAAMVDVPCSCEGTSRKHSDVTRCITDEARSTLTALQERILRSCIRRVRPGGRIVYATCTYAPEENEGVVANVLERPDPGHSVQIVPASIDGLDTAPGLSAWRGRTYPQDMKHAVRLWPGRTNTGGFFSVLLQKTGAEAPQSGRAASPRPSGKSTNASLSIETAGSFDDLAAVYDLDERVTNGLVDLRTGSKYTSIMNSALAADPALAFPFAGSTERHSAEPMLLFSGMRGVNIKSHLHRPSTAMAIRFGGSAGRGVIEIRPEDVPAYLRRNGVAVKQFIPPSAPTPVAIVRSAGCALGLGRIDTHAPNPEDCEVLSLFPKVRAGISAAGIGT